MASNGITARRSFHRIWIAGKKSLVKWARADISKFRMSYHHGFTVSWCSQLEDVWRSHIWLSSWFPIPCLKVTYYTPSLPRGRGTGKQATWLLPQLTGLRHCIHNTSDAVAHTVYRVAGQRHVTGDVTDRRYSTGEGIPDHWQPGRALIHWDDHCLGHLCAWTMSGSWVKFAAHVAKALGSTSIRPRSCPKAISKRRWFEALALCAFPNVIFTLSSSTMDAFWLDFQTDYYWLIIRGCDMF